MPPSPVDANIISKAQAQVKIKIAKPKTVDCELL